MHSSELECTCKREENKQIGEAKNSHRMTRESTRVANKVLILHVMQIENGFNYEQQEYRFCVAAALGCTMVAEDFLFYD